MATMREQLNNDLNLWRPWVDEYGEWVTVKGEKQPFVPGTCGIERAMLTKKQWAELDAMAASVFERCTEFIQCLMCHSQYSGFNGMAKMVLETREAIEQEGAPVFKLIALPLPIIHCDWWVAKAKPGAIHDSLKEPVEPGKWGACEAAVWRVATMMEKTALGVGEPIEFGGHQLYGVFNFPHRLTYKLNDNPVDCVKGMIEHLKSRKFYGPYAVLCSMKEVGDGRINAAALEDVEYVEEVVPCYHLHGKQLAVVQITPDVVQIVVGCEPKLIMWPTEEHKADRHEFKYMGIVVPRLRCDHYNNSGVCVGVE